MSHIASSTLSDPAHLTLLDKLGVWAGWGVAGAMFHTLGWMALAPSDPLGAVSLLARGGMGAMLLQAAGLAAVTAAIAAVLSGRQLAYAGPFAAALGLAVVALRGETAEYLLLSAAGSGESPAKAIAAKLALESVGWLFVVLVALAVSGIVTRWCFGRPHDTQHEGTPAPRAIDGLHFTLIATAASLFAFNILTTGLDRRAIQHGQVCFVVAASVWLGCFLAHRMVAVWSVLWSILSVALLAIVGYLWAGARSPNPNLPPSVPTSHFLRVLPIQFIAVGAAAAIAAYWSMLRHRVIHSVDDETIEAAGRNG
jgi:hypothetical protein